MKRKTFLQTLALITAGIGTMKLTDLLSHAQTPHNNNSAKMPVLFVGHGSPMNALQNNPFTQSLKKLGQQLNLQNPPAAILVISAHWLTRGTFVEASEKPETIHDFGGFPQELFNLQYPAPGSPRFARQVAQLLPHASETTDWGLDHGTWTILLHLFPDAKIPVFQLSIDYYKPMQYHVDIARQLAPLRNKGVLIIGSGNIVHNIPLSLQKGMKDNAQPYDWATEFDQWAYTRIANQNIAELCNYQSAGSAGNLAVPTPDHYIPLLYSMALAQNNDPIEQVYEDILLGGIGMRTFKIG